MIVVLFMKCLCFAPAGLGNRNGRIFSSGLLEVSALSIDSILCLLVADFSSHMLIILFALLMMVLSISMVNFFILFQL